MIAASVLGMELCCALGDSLDTCVSALRTDVIPVGTIQLHDFHEPLRTSYYRIDDGADPLDPDRASRLLPPIVEAVLDRAELSAGQRRKLPVFVGSSCFDIAHSEALYARALREQPHLARPMPQAGFDGLALIAAQAAGSRASIRSWHTACTSAANALLTAQRIIELGYAENALVVGVELANRTSLAGFSALQLLNDTVRPFDKARSGIVLGEGIGAIVLGRRSEHGAMRLTGGAANCDTFSVTGANPDGSTIAEVQRCALQRAGRKPTDVRAIKTHGTGTPANDLSEARGLHQVFASMPPLCALKSRIGHTLGACGVAELVLFAGALCEGFLPSTPGFRDIDTDLDVSPITAASIPSSGTFLLNQFGFGGANTSLVLERD